MFAVTTDARDAPEEPDSIPNAAPLRRPAVPCPRDRTGALTDFDDTLRCGGAPPCIDQLCFDDRRALVRCLAGRVPAAHDLVVCVGDADQTQSAVVLLDDALRASEYFAVPRPALQLKERGTFLLIAFDTSTAFQRHSAGRGVRSSIRSGRASGSQRGSPAHQEQLGGLAKREAIYRGNTGNCGPQDRMLSCCHGRAGHPPNIERISRPHAIFVACTAR
jgi:hypothetical protein